MSLDVGTPGPKCAALLRHAATCCDNDQVGASNASDQSVAILRTRLSHPNCCVELRINAPRVVAQKRTFVERTSGTVLAMSFGAMNCTLDHLTLVLGSTPNTTALRDALTIRKVAHADVVSHLRGVRRTLVRGDQAVVILCVSLDDATVQRYGRDVEALVDAEGCFDTALQVIGLLDDDPLSAQAARMGCHVYAPSVDEAVAAIELLSTMATMRAHEGQFRRTRILDHPLDESRFGSLVGKDEWMERLGF